MGNAEVMHQTLSMLTLYPCGTGLCPLFEKKARNRSEEYRGNRVKASLSTTQNHEESESDKAQWICLEV